MTREEWIKKKKESGSETKYKGSTSKEGVRGIRDKSRVRCFNCQGYGHFAIECRKPKKERESKQEANLTQAHNDDEPALLLTECKKDVNGALLINERAVVPKLASNKETVIDSNIWYLDNGASNHMIGQRDKFRKLNEGVTGQVRFGDGSTVDIKGKGTIAFRCKTREEITLPEVYFIPSLCNNIISLGQMSESGNRIVLSGEFLWGYDARGRLMMKVKRSANRLYKIITETIKPNCLMTVEENTWLWHMRLGHLNFKAMELMSKHNMAQGFPTVAQPSSVCTGYQSRHDSLSRVKQSITPMGSWN